MLGKALASVPYVQGRDLYSYVFLKEKSIEFNIYLLLHIILICRQMSNAKIILTHTELLTASRGLLE